MKKILVPCDFSATAQHAFRFALDIAKKSGGDVLVMHAIDVPISYEKSFDLQPFLIEPSLLKELEDDSKKKFESMKAKYAKGEVKVSFYVEFGPISPTIKNFIENNKIDLVVMGTHGATGMKEFFVGSNTEKIVRSSPVPVWVIRKYVPLETFRNIVMPSTLDLNQTTYIGKVKELQKFLDAKLHVLTVNTPVHFRRDQDMQAELEDFARTFKLKNYTLNMRSDLYEQDGIINFTYETKADLIAMNTHGRKGLAHWLAGSITEDVVNRVHCPIWTFSVEHKKAG